MRPSPWPHLFVCLAVAGVSVVGTAAAQETSLADAKERTRQTPANSEVALAYAKALRRAGREGDALVELRRAQGFTSGPVLVLVDWEIARTQVAKRDFTAAMGACNAITKLPGGGAPLEPGGVPTRPGEAAAAARACKAEAHLLWRRGTEALAELAELGRLRHLVGRTGAVAEEITYAARVAEGRVRELDGKDVEAEANYREALALQPGRSEAHVLLGALLHRTGKDGTPELKKATELDAKDPFAQLELGRALTAEPARRAEAIAALERAVAERPASIDAMRLLTEQYIAANKLPEAKRVAAQVLKIAPNDVFAHVVSGRVALAEGKADEALREGEAAFKLQPNEGKAKLLVADAYAKKGEIDLALEAYQKASGLDPLDPTALVNATYACLAASRVTSAKAFGQRAVLDFPAHAPAWVAQGDALAADGNPKAARTAYEAARRLKGADVAAIDAKLSRLK